MPSLRIDDPRIVEMANQVAKMTGETVEEAVLHSLERRLREHRPAQFDQALYDDLMKITEPSLSVADTRTESEILGYNESGVF